jgi:hypothetical protein
MKRWVFFVLVVSLLVLENGRTYDTLEGRTRALERAIALGENQLQTIEKQTVLIETQTEALNQCSDALNSVARGAERTRSRSNH